MDGILNTIKKNLGVSEDDKSFDVDIITHINTVLVILSQLGIDEVYKCPIIDADTEWIELIGNRTDLEIIKTFIYLKVKLVFDPPASAAAIEAIKQSISELEWRITNLELNKGVLRNETAISKRRLS